jgi:hypothetical protein
MRVSCFFEGITARWPPQPLHKVRAPFQEVLTVETRYRVVLVGRSHINRRLAVQEAGSQENSLPRPKAHLFFKMESSTDKSEKL